MDWDKLKSDLHEGDLCSADVAMAIDGLLARVSELEAQLAEWGNVTGCANVDEWRSEDHEQRRIIGEESDRARLAETRVAELEAKLADNACVDAIDECFRLADGKPEWDYPGQIVHLVRSLLEDRARVAELEALQANTVEGALVTEERAREAEARVAELETLVAEGSAERDRLRMSNAEYRERLPKAEAKVAELEDWKETAITNSDCPDDHDPIDYFSWLSARVSELESELVELKRARYTTKVLGNSCEVTLAADYDPTLPDERKDGAS